VDAAIAANGTLAYVAGAVVTQSTRTLVWVERQGRETPIPAPPRAYVHPRLSPDGTRVALYIADQEGGLWLLDLSRTTLTRVTFGRGVDRYPLWTSDGHRLIFSSQRTGPGNLFWQPADGAAAVERLTESPNAQSATGMSPDGRSLIFTETAPTTGEDVMQMSLDGTRSITPLLQAGFAERNGTVSPDGRWLAYEANDSGQFQIFVRPFPDVNSGRYQVSTAGGNRPLWARSVRELIYVSPTGGLMSVGVARGPSWTATRPQAVVKDGYFTSPGNPGRTYDISPDGQRFLMIKEGSAGQTSSNTGLVVVLNWVEELKRLAPAR
jgi:Tol biopolymer transport system component